MNKKRLIASIIEIIIGGVLLVSSFYGKVDEFWSGMGTSLLIIGVIFLVKNIKYNMDINYRENIDIEFNDERNKYLSLKSWALAGYIFVLCGAVAAIVFKIIGREDCMMMSSASVCLIMILYWISNMYFKRKY